MTVELSPAAQLRAALHALGEGVEAVAFALPGPSHVARVQEQRYLLWSIEEYLLPRLGDLDAPAVAVVLGSTGSGKSTLVNSLAQDAVSTPGPVRPTTRRPVVWAHTDQADRYSGDFLTGYGPGESRQLDVRPSADPLLAGVTVIDSPDFDSVVDENREMADDLLAVADLCIFVTSAQRYADAVPWEFLERARQRSLPIVFVVNRIPTADHEVIVSDYERRLGDAGLAGWAELLAIDEQSITSEHGGLPAASVALLRERLEQLARPEERATLVQEAVAGGLSDVLRRVEALAGAVEDEAAEAAALAQVAERAYQAQMTELARLIEDGSLIRGEVVSRWQSFVGTGQLLQALAESTSRIRRWFRSVFGGKPEVEQVEREARSELIDAVVRRTDLAATAAAGAWELDAAGAELLAQTSGALWRHAPETPDRAKRAVEDWLGYLTKLIEEEGGDRRKVAQVASYGVNAAAVTVLLGVFVHTGGLTGAELGVTASAAAAQQKVLEHVFGSAAARTLIAKAKERLHEVLQGVLHADGARFYDLTGERSATADSAIRLRELAAAVGRQSETYRG
ncbi:MAG: GTPase domain-containing protein [Acidimicrobiia bacterium]|nr:GTPase domain-containing protein [Acidimicrobiia bacterium]